MGRPASAQRLVSLHTLVTEHQKQELEGRARRENISAGVLLRRILTTAFAGKE